MNYLLDVNVLVAWGWPDHTGHRRVVRWLAAVKRKRGARLLTSAIPELGFVRVSVQRSGGRVAVADAVSVLSSMLGSLGSHHGFVQDDRSSARDFPPWCLSAGSTTDGHLSALALSKQAVLATLDTGIPGAFVIPEA